MHPCPRCGSARVTDGRLDGGDAEPRFHPDGIRLLTLRRSVGLDARNAQGCADCGLIWAEGDPGALHEVLADGGTDETKAWLARHAPGRPGPRRES